MRQLARARQGNGTADRATTRPACDRYDLVCLGGGPAGQSAAEMATRYGLRALVVERQTLGGVVVTNAGIPTKTLRETALHITGFRERELYGLSFNEEPQVMLDHLRSRAIAVATQVQAQVRSTFDAHGIDVLYGSARLASSHTVVVTPHDQTTSRTIGADVILLATGSRPFRPSTIPFDDPMVFDSEELFKLRQLPRSILVVGGGAVGCEYASIFTALGIAVTLVDSGPRLLSMMDAELSRLLATVFEHQGMTIKCGVRVAEAQRTSSGLEVTLTDGSIVGSETLLFAAGRSVNTDELGLREIGVTTSPQGWVLVDDNYETSARGVFAAGDIIGPTLASVAMEQGRAAVSHAFALGVKNAVHPQPVSAVYSIPQVAGVGLREEEAGAVPGGYVVGRCTFDALPAAIISGHTEGLLKLVFARTDLRLLGVHSLGEIAAELVAVGQAVVCQGGTLRTFDDLIFANPTYTMAYKDAAFDALKALKPMLSAITAPSPIGS